MRDQYVHRKAFITEKVIKILERVMPVLRILKYRFPIEGVLLEKAIKGMAEKIEKKTRGASEMSNPRVERVLSIYARKRIARRIQSEGKIVSAKSLLGHNGGTDGLNTDTGDFWAVESGHIVRLFSREDAEEIANV